MSVAGKQLELAVTVGAREMIDGTLMRVDQRCQLGKKHLAHGFEFSLSLQHAGKLCEVGFQPVLLPIALGGFSQIGNHRVDVVLQFGYLAASLDLHGTCKVTL